MLEFTIKIIIQTSIRHQKTCLIIDINFQEFGLQNLSIVRSWLGFIEITGHHILLLELRNRISFYLGLLNNHCQLFITMEPLFHDLHFISQHFQKPLQFARLRDQLCCGNLS